LLDMLVRIATELEGERSCAPPLRLDRKTDRSGTFCAAILCEHRRQPTIGRLIVSTANETLVARFFEEVCTEGRSDVAEQIIAPSFIAHDPQVPSEQGPTGAVEGTQAFRDGAEARWEVQELFSAGDRVVARWIGTGTHSGELMGVAPTGKSLTVDAISIFRISEGKLAEEWTVWDTLGLLQQIGVVSP
jgi:predicted SnoaL-like aldol condensation-catalyzing enzyme